MQKLNGPRSTTSARLRSVALGVVIGGVLAGLGSFFVFRGPELFRTGKPETAPNRANEGWYSHMPEGRLDSVRGREDTSSTAPPLELEEWEGVESPTNPQWKVRRGYDVVLAARGFTFPVNIAFVLEPKEGPDSPLYYVNELHGTIKYVTRDGDIRTYATDLNNFKPIVQGKSDETGLSGLMIVPDSEDLLVTGSYLDQESGLLSNHILRLASKPGGRRLREIKVLLDLKEFTAPSNQIQQILAGSDGKLYVSVGDAENHRLSLDLDKFGGKILRLNFDGSACEDNPFFDPSHPESPRSYVYAYGFRNVFDFDFEPGSGRLFAADNGKAVDRLIHVVRGGNYCWNGDDESIRCNAIYTWGPPLNPAPVGLAFLRNGELGGTDFSVGEARAGGKGPSAIRSLYLCAYGPAGRKGKNHAKSMLEMGINPETGMLERGPEHLIQYVGRRMTTVLGLAEGPDGLYFTDFFGETVSGSDPTGKGAVWKVVRSEATLKQVGAKDAALQGMGPIERGQALFSRNCATCHRVAGVGGHEGPELTHAVIELNDRLHSKAYVASVRKFLKSKGSFLIEQRSRLREVLDHEGDDRIDVWLKHHLEEPRFDNTYAKMPSFALLPAEDREQIIAFLKTLR